MSIIRQISVINHHIKNIPTGNRRDKSNMNICSFILQEFYLYNHLF